ncbi:hypothetical protein BH23VER1_BH23VER1_21550 [soil metagenome]
MNTLFRCLTAIALPIVLAPAARSEMNAEEELVQLKQWIVAHYAEIVSATYIDSLDGARNLRSAIGRFVADPTEASLEGARQSWVAARAPYLQSEVFRFYDGPIDGEGGPEGLLNAWPVDESYIEHIIDDSAAFRRTSTPASPTPPTSTPFTMLSASKTCTPGLTARLMEPDA